MLRPTTRSLVLVFVLACACAAPEPEPVPTHVGPERTTPRSPQVPAPPPPEDASGIDLSTEALLERLLTSPEGPAAAADAVAEADARPDGRPLALLEPLELGPGPFSVAGQVVPNAALAYSFARALEGRFAESGPLRGPELLEPVAEEDPPDAAERRRELGRERGARHLLHVRLDRLDQERVTSYMRRARRYVTSERARLAFSYRLIELESGAVARERSFERTYELDGLGPAELASAEWVLAWEAARMVRDDLAEAWPSVEGGADPEEVPAPPAARPEGEAP